MLTLAKMSPKGAIAYYKADNYYQQKDSIECSEWWGDGAEEFGLNGSVDNEDFENLCNGLAPKSKEILRPAPLNQETEAIAGTDATFSAPKSVSLAALVGGDKRLVEAHNRAANKALEVMAARYLKTRVKKGYFAASKPIVAKFNHDTSRDLDPQLHTHCFWMNLVQSPDGSWQSMVNHGFFENKILMGRVYRNALAQECQKLGYEIEFRADGLFELAGYTREQIEVFSQRHVEILEKLKAEGLPDTTGNRIYALFATRKAKETDIDRDAMLDYWRRECNRAQIEHPTPGEPKLEPIDIDERINQAIRHCEERKAIFALEELEKFILETPTGVGLEEIDNRIAAHPTLIVRENEYATEYSLEREKQTLALMEIGKGTQIPLVRESGQQIVFEKLSDSQAIAVGMAITSSDRVMAWVGVAGAGKTHSVNALLSQISPDIEVQGFSPDSSSAEILQRETGLRSDTVAGLLMRVPGNESARKLWVVDEAGKLSAEAARQLLVKSKDENAQILLIGDQKQLTAVEAGNPFKSLIENGVQQSRLRDFRRQRNPVLNRAVQMLYHDMGQTSLSLIHGQGWIKQHQAIGDRTQEVAKAYLSISPLFRPSTKIVAGTHAERELITESIRLGLKAEGVLGRDDRQLIRLRSKDLTKEQKQHARHYEIEDIVIPNRSVNGLRKSQVYKVTGIDGDKVTFHASGKSKVLDFGDLKYKMEAEIYVKGEINIALGDRLKWTRNNRALKRLNGKECTVVGIERDIVSLRYDDGLRDQISLKQLQNIDHALVQTVYASQGMTCDRILVCFGAGQEVSAESILVAMSRAKQSAEFYCSSTEVLKTRVDWSTAQRNPSELLEELGLKMKAPPPPTHIDLKHWIERIEGSGILPEVAELNAESIQGQEVYQRLLESDFENLGSGQLVTAPMRRKMKRYAQVAEGGVWNIGGVDALALPALNAGKKPRFKTWGELKPDNPRLDLEKTQKKGTPQYRKIEAPLGEQKGIFFPEVPDEIADKIYKRYNVNPSPEQRKSGFWPCVYWYPQIEIQVTEGKKKAESIASQNYAAIGLPSVTGGYRAKDENGNRLDRRILHPELQVFANGKRRFLLAFDQDTNENTIKNVRRDLVRTGEALQFEGCPVGVIKWKASQGKGVDDFIVSQGGKVYSGQVEKAIPLTWESDEHYRNEYAKVSGYVQKTWGKAPDQKKLDIGVAIVSQAQDTPRILAQSPAVKRLRDSEDIQGIMDYVKQICMEGDRIKLRLEQRIEVQSITQKLSGH
jgi:conjugative relaxase-like TrwC/TraI family protein